MTSTLALAATLLLQAPASAALPLTITPTRPLGTLRRDLLGVFGRQRWLGALMPIGGLPFLGGWIALTIGVWRS